MFGCICAKGLVLGTYNGLVIEKAVWLSEERIEMRFRSIKPALVICCLLSALFFPVFAASIASSEAFGENAPSASGISWDGTVCTLSGVVNADDLFSEIDSHRTSVTKVILEPDYFIMFQSFTPYNLDSLFANCTQLTSVEGKFFASYVESAESMFENCTSLQSINCDFTTMRREKPLVSLKNMFKGCSALTSVSAGSFNVEDCASLEGVFDGCSSLPKVALTRNTNVASPVSCVNMFRNCASLTSVSNTGEDALNLNGVYYMSGMFQGCTSLQDIHLVRNAEASQTPSSAYTIDSMFQGCTGFEELSLEQFSLSSIGSINNVFKDCTNLSLLNIRGWINNHTFTDTGAFDGCTDLHDFIVSASYVPTLESGFAYGENWFPQAETAKEVNPITGRDAFVTYQAAHPNTVIEYWIAITITYDANGGEFSDETTSRAIPTQYDSPVTYITAAQLVRSGYTLEGWADTATATTPTLDPDNLPQAISSPTTYYAVWQVNQVTVDFNTGQGKFPDQSSTWATTGIATSSLALPPNNPVLSGYDFAGWAATSGASTPDIIPGKPETIPLYKDAAEHYYAVWRVDNTVLFVANGGLFPDGTGSAVTSGHASETLRLPVNQPTRYNYTFDGWATTESAVLPDLDPTSLPTYDNASSTYYAVWQENTKTITFNANGGTWDGTATSKTTTGKLSAICELPETPTRDQYDFLGYATSQGATLPEIVPSDVKTYPTYSQAASTYYAVWVLDTTVVFNANGGTFPSTGAYTYTETGGMQETISLPEQPTRSYFKFLGWADSRTATTPTLDPQNLPNFDTAEGIYYAVWQAATDTVTFHANGGKFADGQDVSATQGPSTSLITLPDSPTWTEHVFLGWSEAQGSRTPEIVPQDTSTYPEYRFAASDYYAVWGSEYTVAFNANQGVFPDGTRVHVEEGDPLTILVLPKSPTRDLYEFLGWADTQGALEPNMPHPLPTFQDASATYYAVWRHVAAHWVEDANGWRYMDDSGNFYTSCWATIDGQSYYFKDDSYRADAGWLTISGQTYYFYANGSHAAGWTVIDDAWHYFNDDGALQTGWIIDHGQWYYLNPDGTSATGWIDSGGQWYYLDPNGVMVSGWQWIDENWFYFFSSGEAARYYWLWDNTSWYYLDGRGYMLHWGWQWIDGAWYCFSDSGSMRTGWIWDGAWYYCYSNGVMARNTWVGGYYVNDSGRWVR